MTDNHSEVDKLLLEAYEPFMMALGELAFQWNALQDEMCSLFCVLLQSKNPDIGEAIWHTVKSDRGQREMLMNLLPVARINGLKISLPFQKDIKDVLNSIMKLENDRNDAIHSPMAIWIEAEGFAIKPNTLSNNPRARNLEGKNLMQTFGYVTHCAGLYGRYLNKVQAKIINKDEPFPKKPQAPPLSQFQNHTPIRRRIEHK
jgi:hypothetical protein